MYQPKLPITCAAEVKAILGPDFPSQIAKVIDHIDVHCKAWIERCPFIVVASINAAGATQHSGRHHSILRNIPLPNISGATPFGKSRILLEGGKPLYRMGSPTK
jgi:hypothetical protein